MYRRFDTPTFLAETLSAFMTVLVSTALALAVFTSTLTSVLLVWASLTHDAQSFELQPGLSSKLHASTLISSQQATSPFFVGEGSDVLVDGLAHGRFTAAE